MTTPAPNGSGTPGPATPGAGTPGSEVSGPDAPGRRPSGSGSWGAGPGGPGPYFAGYHNRPDVTAEAFTGLRFRTGDAGRVDEAWF